MDLSGKKVVVVGLGKSGIAAARLCLKQGASVTGTDTSPESKLSESALTLPMKLVAGSHAGVDFERADLIVVSPGVPPLAAFDQAAKAGVEVIGELELAARFCVGPMIAVGGTNGKSTVTTLLALILEQKFARVFSGGNLGEPLANAAFQSWDVLVVEVSSFQLERAPQFHPKVSLLLNITEDHLDRYPDFQAYANAKGNAFVQQAENDFAVIPADDDSCALQARRGRGKVVTFGGKGDYQVHGRSIIERATKESFSFEESRLFGLHNANNIAACIAAARTFGVKKPDIERALSAYVPLAHRMALVSDVRGVRFYDDSKGTNVGASVTALLGLAEAKGVLIAGGRDKLGDYAPLVEALKAKGRALVVIGEAADRIANAANGTVPISRAASIEQAVGLAMGHAKPGDAVLLSPACSSFDMFSGYAERGDKFVAAVKQLDMTTGECP
jgi:UDP-N-acetylmuramoylalanine--D-glutamate ligase